MEKPQRFLPAFEPLTDEPDGNIPHRDGCIGDHDPFAGINSTLDIHLLGKLIRECDKNTDDIPVWQRDEYGRQVLLQSLSTREEHKEVAPADRSMLHIYVHTGFQQAYTKAQQ